MATLNRSMFREYDIRGQENPNELNVESVTLTAKAYGTFLQKRGISDAVVGHDNRVTSEEFYQAAIRALTESGINVIGVGMCLTPMLYWAQYHFQSKGGVMITASHNPGGWNGLKLAYGYSYTLIDELKEIRSVAESEEFAKGDGSLKEENITEAY